MNFLKPAIPTVNYNIGDTIAVKGCCLNLFFNLKIFYYAIQR